MYYTSFHLECRTDCFLNELCGFSTGEGGSRERALGVAGAVLGGLAVRDHAPPQTPRSAPPRPHPR